MGGSARITISSGTLAFEANIDYGTQSLLAARAKIRYRQRQQRNALLERVTKRGLPDQLTPGADFDPTAISPRLVVCRSRTEHDIFAFSKLCQSVPSAPRPGRRLRLLVMDQGQHRESLIGVVELASPLYALACRDVAFAWGRDGPDHRPAGLRRVMDMSTCVAAPPYSNLRAGKLLALLAASDAVSGLFESRYQDRLAAIVATCATGIHYPHVNRLTVRPGGLYRRVGATAGYSTWMFSTETLAAARELVHDGAPAAPFGPGHVKALQLLRSALRRCGLNEDLLLRTDLAKGVYICDVTGDGVDALRKGCRPRGEAASADECIKWWHDRVLAPVLARSDLDEAIPSKPHARQRTIQP
jgi:hypothetical protein